MKRTPFNWSCPYCGQATTITKENFDTRSVVLDVTASETTDFTVISEAISCPNPNCSQVTLTIRYYKNGWLVSAHNKQWAAKDLLNEWPLLPRSLAKPIPDFVPEEIRSNYLEACLIQSDSPKASAAMSRRCLQGIVRDFWKIPNNKRGNLGAEISFIEDMVDPDTFDSIKAVREVGDIGAHMEKSVDTIVDVEPEEAGLLIELIETLISDWYIARHRRSSRNRLLQETVQAKREAKKQAKNKQSDHTDET